MIDVEIVVAGALGDLVLSTLPNFTAERRLFTRLVVANQRQAGAVLAALEAAGLEVATVTELPRADPVGQVRTHG